MHYDPTRDCYVGSQLVVRASVFTRVMAARIDAGQDRAVALNDLLDELSWSAWMPGVTFLPGADRCGDALWALRPVVAVVHPDETCAELVQYTLEERATVRPPSCRGQSRAWPPSRCS